MSTVGSDKRIFRYQSRREYLRELGDDEEYSTPTPEREMHATTSLLDQHSPATESSSEFAITGGPSRNEARERPESTELCLSSCGLSGGYALNGAKFPDEELRNIETAERENASDRRSSPDKTATGNARHRHLVWV
jgi:hypothetical protein